jgi:hypothetical protein
VPPAPTLQPLAEPVSRQDELKMNYLKGCWKGTTLTYGSNRQIQKLATAQRHPAVFTIQKSLRRLNAIPQFL